MTDYAERREVALGRLRELVAARQRWDDLNYQRMEQEEARMKNEAYAAERAEKLNWLDEGAKGASMGSIAGPWGALVGGIAGTAMGQKEAYDQRRKEGGGGLESFGKTIFDNPFGNNKLTMNNMQDGAVAYGNAKAKYDQDQARKSKSLDENQYKFNQERNVGMRQNDLDKSGGQFGLGGAVNMPRSQPASNPWNEADTSYSADYPDAITGDRPTQLNDPIDPYKRKY